MTQHNLDFSLFLVLLFLNSDRFMLSRRQYHQEIEEFVSNLVKRFEDQQKNDVEKTSFNLLPQVFQT